MNAPGWALVTGGSRGLGKYFARALAARQHNLVLVARHAEPLENLANELRTKHDTLVETLTIDLARSGAGHDVADELKKRNLPIDLLINNAGFGEQGRFVELPLSPQVKSISLQNATVVELTYEVLPQMIERQRGGIINISSMAGFQPIPFAAVYSATKSFLTTFSLALEAEVQRHGIKVVTVCPGRLRADPEEPLDRDRKKVPGGEQTHEEIVRASLEKLDRGGGLLIPGGMNKFASVAVRFAPRGKIARLVKKISSK